MEYFGLTDKGRVRPTNQDIFQIEAREDNQTALLVVCDGCLLYTSQCHCSRYG